ncbi:hypothetical protein CPC08DRAFT_723165 [Agrocybe pediades]|nr:hypothetical protein CPC08DRAFT_723165 [Agrocybe pediades]
MDSCSGVEPAGDLSVRVVSLGGSRGVRYLRYLVLGAQFAGAVGLAYWIVQFQDGEHEDRAGFGVTLKLKAVYGVHSLNYNLLEPIRAFDDIHREVGRVICSIDRHDGADAKSKNGKRRQYYVMPVNQRQGSQSASFIDGFVDVHAGPMAGWLSGLTPHYLLVVHSKMLEIGFVEREIYSERERESKKDVVVVESRCSAMHNIKFHTSVIRGSWLVAAAQAAERTGKDCSLMVAVDVLFAEAGRSGREDATEA